MIVLKSLAPLFRAFMTVCFCFVAVCALSRSAHAQFCTPYWVNDHLVMGLTKDNGKTISRSFDAEMGITTKLFTEGLNLLTSASKVDTAQRSADGTRNALALRQGAEGFAQVVNQQQMNSEILDANEEFGNEGHIANVCGDVAVVGQVVRSLGSSNDMARNILQSSKIPAAPGGTITAREALSRRIGNHLDTYCSSDEVSAGLCRHVGSRPSADVQAYTLFDPTASQDDVDAYINNLVGDPLEKPDQREANTPAGVLKMMTAMKAEGIRSPALTSLAALRAQSAGGSGYNLVSQSNVTVVQALDEIMALYGGGPRYQDWDARLSGAGRYGVLRELVKLRGLSMKLRNYQTQSLTRISAMLSTILAAEAGEQQ